MEEKERKTWLPEHPEDFGNTQAEEMFRDFFAEQFAPIGTIEKASKFDDKFTHIDNVVYRDKKPFLAIQQKFTASAERLTEAGKEILNHPLAQLHDDGGNLVTNEKVPIVMVQDKIERWGKAYNKYIKEKLQSPLEALEDKTEIKKKFLKQMIELLKAERYYYPQHQELFDARISILEDLLKNAK